MVRCGPLGRRCRYLLKVDYRAFAEETGSSCPDERAVIRAVNSMRDLIDTRRYLTPVHPKEKRERERKTDRI